MSETEVVLDMSNWDTFMAEMFGRIQRPLQLLKAAAEAFAFQDIIEHFRNEEGPSGHWPARAESTQRAYAMIQSGQWKPPSGYSAGSFSPSNKLLQLTGFLRQSIVPQNTTPYGRDAIKIFSTDKKSGAHDAGTRNIPQRQFMWLSDNVQEKMASAIAQMIIEGGV